MSVAPHIVVQPTRVYVPQGAEARTAGTMPVAAAKTGGEGSGGFLGFVKGILDIINPLQHIPVVGTLYRKFTGDEIAPAARIAGGALFGGPLGGGLAMADMAFAEAKGSTMGETVMAALGDKPAGPAAPTQMADAAPLRTEDITWDDAPAMLMAAYPHQTPKPIDVSLSAIPAPDRMRTASSAPANSSGPDTQGARHAPAENAGQTGRYHGGPSAVARLTTHASVNAALSLPDAPADPRMGLPPELMALKMQEGLDKYAAMKANGL